MFSELFYLVVELEEEEGKEVVELAAGLVNPE
jgi:hypothetical protein